jgi:hypothetical protein
LLAEVGSAGSTVFVPYSPGTMSTVADEFRHSLMEADAAALDGRKSSAVFLDRGSEATA